MLSEPYHHIQVVVKQHTYSVFQSSHSFGCSRGGGMYHHSAQMGYGLDVLSGCVK